MFPGLTDLLHELDVATSLAEKELIKEELRAHLSDLMIVIKAAGNSLEDVAIVV